LEEIRDEAKKEWQKLYGTKSSVELKQLVNDYEAMPFIQNEVKSLLERKEAEMIKKRN